MADVAEQVNIGKRVIGDRQIQMPESVHDEVAMLKVDCFNLFHIKFFYPYYKLNLAPVSLSHFLCVYIRA